MSATDRDVLFEATWDAIDQRYVDPAGQQVDWAAVKDEFAPRVAAAHTATEMDALMSEMVSRLGDCATWFIPPDAMSAPGATAPFAGIGVVSRADGRGPGDGIGLFYVYPGGPADRSGLVARDRILSADGVAVTAPEQLRGELGTGVELVVRSPGGSSRAITLTRGPIEPTLAPEQRILPGPGRIGYLRLPLLSTPDAWDATHEALAGLAAGAALDGLVLDLRGTSGGQLNDADLVAQFVAEPFLRVRMADGGPVPYVGGKGDLYPQLKDVPLAVLIDGGTGDSADAIAGELDATGRAVMVGSPTNGCVRGTESIDLPGGAAVNVSEAAYLLPDGSAMGIASVLPDVPMSGEWLAQPADQDTWISAAAAAIRAD